MLRQENEDISKFKFGNKLNDPVRYSTPNY